MSRLCVLVFPIDFERSLDFIIFAKSMGFRVVGASSVMSEERSMALPIDDFAVLPFVNTPEFPEKLSRLLGERQITHVYSAHGVVWSYIRQWQREGLSVPKFQLATVSPYDEDWVRLLPSFLWSDETLSSELATHLGASVGSRVKPVLNRAQLASLHRQYVSIPGQSDEDKLQVLQSIFRILPEGDLVEIGSFQGRSAFAIAWLAKVYGVGNLVCVDPWSSEKIEDQGNDLVLSRARNDVDLDRIFCSFIASTGLLGNVGYIRDLSADAATKYAEYARLGCLPPNELNSLSIAGEIALLHIDGNHRYDFVKRDVEVWAPFVMSGGWILLDDYVWAFGDGPRLVGDELLATGMFDMTFSASDTLFLRKI